MNTRGTLERVHESVTAKRNRVAHFVTLTVLGVAILQAVWIAVVPPFRGTDEFDHAYRAAGVATGQWVATEAPENGRGLLVLAPESLVSAAHDQCASLGYTGPDNCNPVRPVGNGLVEVASGAGAYNPLFYWVIGNAAEPFQGVAALYVMRAVGALLCLLFIGMAAWATAVRRASTWSRLGFVVAITPVMLYSTALGAPNGIEMAAALAFWCALLSLDDSLDLRIERILVGIASVSASVLVVARTLGPMFALLVLATVWILNRSLVSHVIGRHRRTFIAGSALVLAAASWAVVWFIMNGAGRPAPDAQGGSWGWSKLLLWPLQTIAAFPFRDQPGALIVYPVVLAIFFALVIAALRISIGRERWALTTAVLVSIAVPLVLTAATYDGRGAMWQGRYGLPYSIGIVLLATAVLDNRRWSTRLRQGLVVIGSLLMAVSTAACFSKVLALELDRPVSATDMSWHAPGLTVVVALTMFAWLLLHRAYSARDDARDLRSSRR